MENYITQRKQARVVHNETSVPGFVRAGVTQGSSLRPLLFLWYINDITDNLLNIAFLFVGDTSLSYSGTNSQTLQSNINNDLGILSQWSKRWLVDLNTKKTKALVISNIHVPSINIQFDGCKNSQTFGCNAGV